MELEYQTQTGRPGRRSQPRKLGPLLGDPELPFAAPTPLFLASKRETDENYGAIVAVINPELRIVTGSCGLQWIVQRRRNPLTWTSFAFCKTKEGLLLRLPKGGHGCDPEAWALIESLPDYFPKQAKATKAA